nr:retrovirus-related Pol polyprotein from transposon TNT 1-94 [Tanacetum cinerariifolium]
MQKNKRERESCSDGDGRENGRKRCREKGGKHCAGHSVLNRNVTGGAIHLSRNHVFHERTKHINVLYHFIREVLEAKTVEVLKVGTEHNATNALTKVVPGHKLQHCLELLSVVSTSRYVVPTGRVVVPTGREVLEAKTVEVLKVGTEHNAADALTKVRRFTLLIGRTSSPTKKQDTRNPNSRGWSRNAKIPSLASDASDNEMLFVGFFDGRIQVYLLVHTCEEKTKSRQISKDLGKFEAPKSPPIEPESLDEPMLPKSPITAHNIEKEGEINIDSVDNERTKSQGISAGMNNYIATTNSTENDYNMNT